MKMIFTCMLFCFLVIISGRSCCKDEFPEVNAKTGTYRGIRQLSSDHFHYEQYLGVQFADFNGRFKKAQYPPKRRNETVDATKLGKRCIQMEYVEVSFEQDDAEDCLNLNIYVPWGVKCLGSRKLPVVIGIHGGGFEIGSASWIHGGDILDVARDVIFVSIQYRLGIWGLLTTGDDISPGNLLYWDQHYAIRWVHDNIKYFGGNPEEVTLWGYSAGGSSTMVQAFYKGNKGLIKRGIPVTGGAVGRLSGEWHCNIRETYIKNFKNVAGALQCPVEPSWAMVECLQQVDNQKLLEASNRAELLGGRPLESRWYPVIDGEFLDDVPYQLFKEGRTEGIDFMHGIGHHDIISYLYTSQELPDEASIHKFWRNRFRFQGIQDVDKYVEILKTHYGEDTFGIHPNSIEAANRENDRLRVAAHLLDIRYHEKFTSSKNQYFYVLDHHSENSEFPHWVRGNHFEICAYAFGIILSHPEVFNATEEEKEMSRDMIRYQFNFAKTGNPNIGSGIPTEFPNWDTNSRRLLRFSPISEGGYQVESGAYSGVEDFWEQFEAHKDKLDRDKLCADSV